MKPFKFLYKIKKYIKKSSKATILCIKYPFLYPRNRFNGLHYNNWKIINFLNVIKKEYRHFIFSQKDIKSIVHRYNKEWYFQQTSKSSVEYWTNWWAKPLYNIIQFYHNYILQIFHCIPTYTEWDAMEPGWKKTFGEQYLKELKEAAIKDNYLKKLRIMQLKEKYGRCVLYLNLNGDNVNKVISKYEELSWHVCIKCGQYATHESRGWISPYCEECASTQPEMYIKRNTEEYNEYFNNL